MSASRLLIRHLVFTGNSVPPAELTFDTGCNLVWGASNTGKSFALEAIDFMLGGSGPLPGTEQIPPAYDTIWLGFAIKDKGEFTLSRAVKGGSFSLHEGLIKQQPPSLALRRLKQTHDSEKTDRLSGFLLEHIGLGGKSLARNRFGEQQSLSFRNIAKIVIADEIDIQQKRSPIESGHRTEKPLERSVFRLMLSGVDDAAIVSVEDPKKTRASKAAKVELLDEMIGDLDAQVASKHPDVGNFEEQDGIISRTLESIQIELDTTDNTIRSSLKVKQQLALELPSAGERLDEIEVHLSRFAQLSSVFESDARRLEAIEEVGFLVSLVSERNCPLCGAEPEAQQHRQSIRETERIRAASVAEIEKIELLRADLERTVVDLRSERESLRLLLPQLRERLREVEDDISKKVSVANRRRSDLAETLKSRDKIKERIALKKERDRLLAKKVKTERVKPVSKRDLPDLSLPRSLIQEFCDVVRHVLGEWSFPGQRVVSFDEKHFDIRIDGKLRKDNGKGVRAVTHAAFKVGMLLFCHEKELPHPGFVVLDTPLLTYRDPIRAPKHGKLSGDEKVLAQTSLKQKFFEHLHSLRGVGQFIIFENVDLPGNIRDLARVETFSGGPGGRVGFFPREG